MNYKSHQAGPGPKNARGAQPFSGNAILFLTIAFVCLSAWTASARLQLGNSLVGKVPTSNAADVRSFSSLDPQRRSGRALTFQDRLAYQRAIEEIYWRHRIWTENSKPKPTLDELMPASQIQRKVETYLRQSQALADYWQRPVTPEQLQAEMTRMSRDTKEPDTLRELYEALNNDPLVIAECLARPALVDRLIREAYSSDERFHREVKQRAEADLRTYPSIEALQRGGRNYSERQVSTKARKKIKVNAAPRVGIDSVRLAATGGRLELLEDEVSYYVMSVVPVSEDRWNVRRITWNKEPCDSWWSRIEDRTAMADPAKDYDYSFSAISQRPTRFSAEAQAALSSPPTGRTGHTAIWTGSEMIVWGGFAEFDANNENTGGRYNPATDSWTTTTTNGAPSARNGHTAIWSGSEMIVWGGLDDTHNPVSTGGRYNPSTDLWVATSTNGVPVARFLHTSIWTGTEMIVWGGNNLSSTQNIGGRYNPGTNTWTSTNTVGAPTGRDGHTAVWTGSEMIIWGGGFSNTGGRYRPATNDWISTTTTGAPSARSSHTAVWSGNEMIVWGGSGFLNTGGRYNPTTNSWTSTNTSGAPLGRERHTAVWTGSEMIVWGGISFQVFSSFNTGGRYNPTANTWTATSVNGAPKARDSHTAVWTGTQMIVWGGVTFDGDLLNSGGRYTASSNTWLATSTARVPNGPAIVFASGRVNEPKIYLMDLDGANRTRVTNDTSYDDQPRWLADGTKIVFMSKRDGNFEIYSMNADGSAQTRLTNNPAADGFPAWSPDGTRIAFISGDTQNATTFELYVMNADGTNRIRLTNDSLIDGVPSWSPDGTKIVFMSGAAGLMDANSFEIFTVNANGSNRTRLTTNTVVDAQPSFSPDGAKILFASGDAMNPNGIEIFVMNADGSNRTQLTSNSVTDGFPRWSPDGTKIIFASGSVADETTAELLVMNANGTNRTQLTHNSVLDWFPDLQPSTVVTPTTIQFGATNYNSGEGDGSVIVTVNRSGDASGVSTVDFSSSNGTASQLGDYEVANGTLTFAAGQTSRTFRVLIVDDVYAEANETVTLTLSNATGATLTGATTATATIVDNDSGGTTSPIARQFVSNLVGADEVPATPNTVKGNGGIVQLSNDELSAKVSLLFSGLTGSETGAHVHAGAPGVNGPIIFPLPLGNPINNFVINPSGQQVADLRAGQQYMNVHSTGFQNGEIRGQLQWNPAEEADFFVRQAYFDFLSRVPDPSGFTFWTAEITNCQTDVGCLRRKRVDVSNAFFYEQEFQQTAAYVLRLYRGAYGNNQPFPNPNPNASFPNEEKKLPSYAVFVADRARVIGGANLAQKQLDLANLFVSRPEFLTKYPASLATADQFVDAVLATLQTDMGVNLSGQRANLINLYNTQGGRGVVMYRLADDNATNPIVNQPFIDEEYNRTFVLGQYFGYLRRNPDIPGFIFWLGQVNGAPLKDVPKQHAMVCSFITSGEFQFRFGPVASRNNNECPQ